MGLYVNHLSTISHHVEKELYIYLLDYGWPAGVYEKMFKDYFHSMAKRASETGSIVIASHGGVHFANEVLSYYRIFDLNPDEILPAILLTKVPPTYFKQTIGPEEHSIPSFEDDELCNSEVVLVPLKPCCSTPEDFSSLIESVFTDLSAGLELKSFRISSHDKRYLQSQGIKGIYGKFRQALILEPKMFGVGVDLKKLFGSSS